MASSLLGRYPISKSTFVIHWFVSQYFFEQKSLKPKNKNPYPINLHDLCFKSDVWNKRGIRIFYLPAFVLRMARSGKEGEFPPCERMFVCQLKLTGKIFYEDPCTFLKIYLYVNLYLMNLGFRFQEDPSFCFRDICKTTLTFWKL